MKRKNRWIAVWRVINICPSVACEIPLIFFLKVTCSSPETPKPWFCPRNPYMDGCFSYRSAVPTSLPPLPHQVAAAAAQRPQPQWPRRTPASGSPPSPKELGRRTHPNCSSPPTTESNSRRRNMPMSFCASDKLRPRLSCRMP